MQPLGRGVVCRGRLRIIDTITGYEKRSTRDNRLLTIVPLEAPPQIFETEGLWYVIPESCRQRLEDDFVHFMCSIQIGRAHVNSTHSRASRMPTYA